MVPFLHRLLFSKADDGLLTLASVEFNCITGHIPPRNCKDKTEQRRLENNCILIGYVWCVVITVVVVVAGSHGGGNNDDDDDDDDDDTQEEEQQQQQQVKGKVEASVVP